MLIHATHAMPTLEEAQSDKRELESLIKEIIDEYEDRYGAEVERISIQRRQMTDDGSLIAKIDLEVTL